MFEEYFIHFQYLLTFLWILAIIVYASKLFIPLWDQFTRFGKLEQVNSHLSFIPSISNKIGWIIFYLFSCIMFFGTLLLKYPSAMSNKLLFIHSSRRLLESIFITNFSNRKMHFINLAAGLCFYGMTPLTLCLSSKEPSPSVLYFVIAVVFNALQFIAHYHLASLPKYSIPTNFLFKITISPHYAIEIFLYFIYMLTAFSFNSILMFLFVSFNLTHQSIMTYRWYVDKFGDRFTVLYPYV